MTGPPAAEDPELNRELLDNRKFKELAQREIEKQKSLSVQERPKKKWFLFRLLPLNVRRKQWETITRVCGSTATSKSDYRYPRTADAASEVFVPGGSVESSVQIYVGPGEEYVGTPPLLSNSGFSLRGLSRWLLCVLAWYFRFAPVV